MDNKNINSDESLPVYEAEFIDEEIEENKYLTTVSNKTTIANKIGKAIGIIASTAGLLLELGKFLPPIYQNDNKNGKKKMRRRFRSKKNK